VLLPAQRERCSRDPGQLGCFGKPVQIDRNR
jgi:hypothetical protein